MAQIPDSKLTPAQFEIMEVVWNAEHGATVAEIWESISEIRDVGRTTVLNLVGRLEKRGWLVRSKDAGAYRYLATVSRDDATTEAAHAFVNDFFSGSASNLVMSLLGSRQIDPAEVQRLRELLDEQSPKFKRRSSKR